MLSFQNYNIKYASVPAHFDDPISKSSANDPHPSEKNRINWGTSCNTALSDDSRKVLGRHYPFFTPPFDTSVSLNQH